MAIARLKEFEPPEGYYLAFSGGKDSITIKKLADLAGVKYDAHYSNTTIDPPELIYFIRKHHKEVKWENPEKPFLTLLSIKGFPTRISRWCCQIYKEQDGSGRIVMTGIRRQESTRRNKRRLIETCYRDTTKRFINVIIDWSDTDVWEFIEKYKIPYCKLYDEGNKRIGCLMCPLANKYSRKNDSIKYPRYTELFKKAFIKLYEYRKKKKNPSIKKWKNGTEMFYYWLLNDSKMIPDQTTIFE